MAAITAIATICRQSLMSMFANTRVGGQAGLFGSANPGFYSQ
jgi:hypothetical protein